MMKLILAPMAGITNSAFRLLVEASGGADEYFSEMINAATLVSGSPYEDSYINRSPLNRPFTRQLVGKDALIIAKAAAKLRDIDKCGIDMNFACSAPAIIRAGGGIAWMHRNPTDVKELIRALKAQAPKVRLSAKLRLGEEDFTTDSLFAFSDILVSEGVTLLTLHPRTRREKEKDKVRYPIAELMAKRYKGKVCVYVSGGVRNAHDFQRVMAECPSCDGVMIGIGAVERPWIFRELRKVISPLNTQCKESRASCLLQDKLSVKKESSITIDALSVARRMLFSLKEREPLDFFMTRAKRFFYYYTRQFFFSHYLRTKLSNAKDIDEMQDILVSYFTKQSEERFIEV